MAIKFNGRHIFSDLALETGKELLELWLKTGAIKKARLRYNSDHPNDLLLYDNIFSRRIRFWAVENVPEMIELIQSYDSKVTIEMIQEKILYYAVRVLTYKRFLSWVDKNSWAKKYETDYNKWYGK